MNRQPAEVIATQVAFALGSVTRAEDKVARQRSNASWFALEAAAPGHVGTPISPHWLVRRSERLRTNPRSSRRAPSTPPLRDLRALSFTHDDRERVLDLDPVGDRRWASPMTSSIASSAVDGRVRLGGRARGASNTPMVSPVRMTGVCIAVTWCKEAEFARLAYAARGQPAEGSSFWPRSPTNCARRSTPSRLDSHAGTRIHSPERVRHAVDIIRRNAKLQAQLIEDILDVDFGSSIWS